MSKEKEKDIAEKCLKEEWPDHPKEVNPNNLMDVTKQTILLDSEIDREKRETISIATCYRYKNR